MNSIVFKVAPRGEGKTKWLLTIAKDFSQRDGTTYLATKDEHEYTKFCEKYFRTFDEVCSVIRYCGQNIDPSDVVLIDNLMEQQFSTKEIVTLQNKCKCLFITIDGVTEYTPVVQEYEQLRIEI